MKNKSLFLILIIAVLFCLSVGYRRSNWSKSSTPETINGSAAIGIIKNKYPELKEYPSDKLAPKSIKTEKASEGWYIAFVQEGSGVPIIDARCFLVKNDNSIVQIKYTPQDNTFVGEFSAEECGLIENVVGGDKDEHGCIGSAGYSWCQGKQKCLRTWEEPCEGTTGDSSCALETCHGLNIVCGSSPPMFVQRFMKLEINACDMQNAVFKMANASRHKILNLPNVNYVSKSA